MGQKDIATKVLESYNDVFADIVNVLLFNGEEVVKVSELTDQSPRSAYKADGKYREIERDVAKRWKQGNIHVACIGMENQVKADVDMPLRVLAYDGAEYRAQLYHGGKNRYPVVTMVLYFNHDRRWDAPVSLFERVDVPDRFKRFVNDYRINMFDIAFLTEKQVKLFKSDFRHVADYFVQKRSTGTYVGSTDEIKHVQETLSMMAVLTNDHRFEEMMKVGDEGKEIRTMCDVLDRVEEKGRKEGVDLLVSAVMDLRDGMPDELLTVKYGDDVANKAHLILVGVADR
ncbi:MAG: Rpn family recombination-promoting nuclease/putative transposase [Lachnospiraceae bacterium]|nr:Rpn family recombination-promoting nuclease/putative transposase [Lachnospiraceae bacterium]